MIWLRWFAYATVVLSGFLCASPGAAQSAGASLEERIDTLVMRQMLARHIPGLSLGVVRNGQLVYAKGYGQANLEWPSPASPETVYLLASLTKQFTATGIMMLVQEGRLQLDDTIGAYVAAPPSWNGITIRQLLTHTAGLKDRFEQAADGRFFMDYSTQQMLDAAKQTATDFAPGTRWQYSDQGYFLLGLVIEKISGRLYERFLRERIFEPLGMSSSSVHNWRVIVPQRADGYALLGETVIGSRRRYQFSVASHYGVQSSVRDLARYDSALSAGRLVSPATLAQMWTPGKLNDGSFAQTSGIGYGFGWLLERFNGHRLVHHAGSTGTCIFKLPDDGVSVIVLTNLEQLSGSDPCFIARGVATRYVPAASIVDVPAARDGDAARTRRLRAALEALARGEPNAADYTPEYFSSLRSLVPAQKAALEQLGRIESFELIADDTLAAQVVYYRVRYAQATLHFRFVLDAQGRIAGLSGR